MPRSARRSAAFACVLLLFFGCSSESSNPGTAKDSCAPLCDAIDGAGCPGESKLRCTTLCDTTSNDCSALTSALSKCVVANKEKITCDSDGTAVFNGCESEFYKILPCSVCIPLPNDTAGEQCMKQNCCQPLQNAYARTDVVDYFACLDKCGTGDQCIVDCSKQYSATATNFATVNSCQDQYCPTPAG